MLIQPWRIELLGGLCARSGVQVVTRFQSRKVAALLAYLAVYSSRPHQRDGLVTLLWPDDDLDAARNRLRVGLNSLRRQLEPTGTPSGSVLMADRVSVHLHPEAFTTDVATFENAVNAGMSAAGDTQSQLMVDAVEAYTGDLLPGFFDDWVLTERERLANMYLQALRCLTHCLVRERDYERALVYARRAVQCDPLREEAHRDVMRLCLAVGRPADAQEQYEELKRGYHESLSALPSSTTQKLARQIAERIARPAGLNVLRQEIVPLAAPRPDIATAGTADSDEPARLSERSRLPVFLSRFFGRERELDAICALLSPPEHDSGRKNAARLVTLTGPGGMGKTRLAVAVGERLRATFDNRVWFIPLADVTDPNLLSDAVVAAMRLSRLPKSDPHQQVFDALGEQPALLLLDNCEHLSEDIAPLLEELLIRIPRLACLLTSRRSLGVFGEREIVVAPLPVPEVEENSDRQTPELAAVAVHATDPIALLANPAVEMFVDRAQAVQPDFRVTQHNAGDMAALCRELEGIPLAIELAATRARVFTPAQMRVQLGQRFELLVNRRADKTMRHRSLRAAVEWSYHLLRPDLRQLFAQLSVFAGGWNLQAAWAVCQGGRGVGQAMPEHVAQEQEAEPDLLLLDQIEQLRIDSLILAETVEGEIRFRMLETLRDFARTKLLPEERDGLASRFMDYYASFAEHAAAHLKSGEQALWLHRLDAERDNLRAVCDLCLQRPDGAEAGFRLALSLNRFWVGRGLVGEARRRCAGALAHPGGRAKTALRADTLLVAGNLALDQDDFNVARELFEQAHGTAQAADYRHGVAYALGGLGLVSCRQGDNERAYTTIGQSLAIHRENGDGVGVAQALGNLAVVAQNMERYAEAKALHEQSLVLLTNQGDRWATAKVVGNLGMLADWAGDYPAAIALFEQSMAIHHQLKNLEGIATLLGNLGIVASKQGNYEQGRDYFGKALVIFRKLKLRRSIAMLKGNLGSLESLLGRHEAARTLHEESLALHRELNNSSGILHALTNLGRAHIALGDLPQGRSYLYECLRECHASNQLLVLAAVLDEFAALADAEGRMESAVYHYAAAEAVRERMSVPLSPAERRERDGIDKRLRTLLGESAYSSALLAGRSAPLERIVQSILVEEAPTDSARS